MRTRRRHTKAAASPLTLHALEPRTLLSVSASLAQLIHLNTPHHSNANPGATPLLIIPAGTVIPVDAAPLNGNLNAPFFPLPNETGSIDTTLSELPWTSSNSYTVTTGTATYTFPSGPVNAGTGITGISGTYQLYTTDQGYASFDPISNPTGVTVKYTYFGDANLDGTVDSTDGASLVASGTFILANLNGGATPPNSLITDPIANTPYSFGISNSTLTVNTVPTPPSISDNSSGSIITSDSGTLTIDSGAGVISNINSTVTGGVLQIGSAPVIFNGNATFISGTTLTNVSSGPISISHTPLSLLLNDLDSLADLKLMVGTSLLTVSVTTPLLVTNAVDVTGQGTSSITFSIDNAPSIDLVAATPDNSGTSGLVLDTGNYSITYANGLVTFTQVPAATDAAS